MPSKIISPDQAAKLLGITPHGVRYLIRRGILRASLLGRTWLIEEKDVAKLPKRKRLTSPKE